MNSKKHRLSLPNRVAVYCSLCMRIARFFPHARFVFGTTSVSIDLDEASGEERRLIDVWINHGWAVRDSRSGGRFVFFTFDL